MFRFDIVAAIEGMITDLAQDACSKSFHSILQKRLRDVFHRAGYRAKVESEIPFTHFKEQIFGRYDLYFTSDKRSVAIEFDRLRVMKRESVEKLLQGDSDISIAIALGTTYNSRPIVQGNPRLDNIKHFNTIIEETKSLIIKEWGKDSAQWLRLAEKECWLCVLRPWSFEQIAIEI